MLTCINVELGKRAGLGQHLLSSTGYFAMEGCNLEDVSESEPGGDVNREDIENAFSGSTKEEVSTFFRTLVEPLLDRCFFRSTRPTRFTPNALPLSTLTPSTLGL